VAYSRSSGQADDSRPFHLKQFLPNGGEFSQRGSEVLLVDGLRFQGRELAPEFLHPYGCLLDGLVLSLSPATSHHGERVEGVPQISEWQSHLNEDKSLALLQP